jgi:poly(A) polymerase
MMMMTEDDKNGALGVVDGDEESEKRRRATDGKTNGNVENSTNDNSNSNKNNNNNNNSNALDVKRTKELDSLLKLEDVYESASECTRREEVLGELNEMLQDWIRTRSLSKGHPDESIRCNLYTFGSYRLGVHGPAADIDSLVIGPKHIDRSEDFFGFEEDDYAGSFYDYMRKHEGTEKIVAVPDAVVPELKTEFRGFEIDVAYCSLPGYSNVPLDLDVLSAKILHGLDDAGVKSLAGCRVADSLLKLVTNHSEYRIALRALRLWAARRGVYSNVVGFFGGVNLAILVARVCQLYPNASASMLVYSFFQIWDNWVWTTPVMLTSLDIAPKDQIPGLRHWDERVNKAERYQMMKIITPAYPAQNSTFNVSSSTLEVLKREFKRGKIVTGKVLIGEAKWTDVWSDVHFFAKYKTYLQLIITADNEEDFKKWEGWVGSRLKNLVQGVETFSEGAMMAHPGVKKFYDPEKDKEVHCNVFFGLFPNPSSTTTAAGEKKKINLNPAIENFQMTVGNYIDRATGTVNWKPGMGVQIKLLRKKDVPSWALPEGGKYEESAFESAGLSQPAPENNVASNANNNKRAREEEHTEEEKEKVEEEKKENGNATKKAASPPPPPTVDKEEEEKDLLLGSINDNKESERTREEEHGKAKKMKVSFASVVKQGSTK